MTIVPVEAPITEYLHNKAARLRIPLNGTFELTPVCNMNCKMCYVRMSAREQAAIRPLRTAAEWLDLGREAREQGLLYLLLTGGEPFLRPDLQEILSGLHRQGLLISINSNAPRIGRETVGWLRETPPVRINVTLYGASNETYARLCGNPDGFDQAVEGIRLLREAGIAVKLNCSVTPWNKDDLPAIFRFAEEQRLIVQATSYMFPPLRRDAAQVGKNQRFSPEEAAYYAAKIEALSNGEEAYLEHMRCQGAGSLPGDSAEDCMRLNGEEGGRMRCRAGKCSFWVTWDGRLLPCGMLPGDRAPDVFAVGMEKAWRQVVAAADAVRLPAACQECALADQCRACAAMVLTESGDYRTVPEYRCRMAHSYGAESRRLEQELLNKRQVEVTHEK